MHEIIRITDETLKERINKLMEKNKWSEEYAILTLLYEGLDLLEEDQNTNINPYLFTTPAVYYGCTPYEYKPSDWYSSTSGTTSVSIGDKNA
ncbi:hypothetical protein M0R19_03105 [Candidatus Pacearchaeota archaeon]|jgi:uncharacterized membrane protein|nr:hypothetical protein [Candidatus Pacearchaeota archaeon]